MEVLCSILLHSGSALKEFDLCSCAHIHTHTHTNAGGGGVGGGGGVRRRGHLYNPGCELLESLSGLFIVDLLDEQDCGWRTQPLEMKLT